MHLEALRGLSALLVVFHHALSNDYPLSPDFHLRGIWQYAPPGHLSVIVFFALSGYVIGLKNQVPLDTAQQWRLYLKKRFVRLYPIYLIAILLTIAVSAWAGKPVNSDTIFPVLLFGAPMVTEVWGANLPIWSLSFEVLFYLLFLPMSALRLSPLLVAGACCILGLLNSKLGVAPLIVSSVLFGAAIADS